MQKIITFEAVSDLRRKVNFYPRVLWCKKFVVQCDMYHVRNTLPNPEKILRRNLFFPKQILHNSLTCINKNQQKLIGVGPLIP